MEFFRAHLEKRRAAFSISDPQPFGDVMVLWRALAPVATVGLFLLVLIACLYAARSLAMPVAAGLVVALTLTPLVKRAAQHGVPSWLSGPLLVLLFAAGISAAISVLAAPLTEWIERAPEIGANLRDKLYVLDQPLAALRALQEALTPRGDGTLKVDASQSNLLMPLVAYLTPAFGELLIFAGVLTFALIGQYGVRKYLVLFFASREAKLRTLKILNDIESNLTGYLSVVTAINVGLGVVTGFGAWLYGLPNPIALGLLAAVANFVPYIGAGVTAIVVFVVSLVTFPTLAQAILPPLSFLALTTLEGQFITPAIIGQRLTLSPLMVILALAFWTWLWGPFGAFLAVPLSIILLVIFNHLFPKDDDRLPE